MSSRAVRPTNGDSASDADTGGAVVIRHTRQQAAVDEIFRDQHDFRTAQQIFDELRDRGRSVSLTTVYRTLQRMSAVGSLDSIRTDDGEMAYRRCSTRHHHHLVCRNCGRTVEVAAPEVETWTQQIATEHGFTDVRHDVEIFGLCADCAAR